MSRNPLIERNINRNWGERVRTQVHQNWEVGWCSLPHRKLASGNQENKGKSELKELEGLEGRNSKFVDQKFCRKADDVN